MSLAARISWCFISKVLVWCDHLGGEGQHKVRHSWCTGKDIWSEMWNVGMTIGDAAISLILLPQQQLCSLLDLWSTSPEKPMQAGEAQPGGFGCLHLPGWASPARVGIPHGLVMCLAAWRATAIATSQSAASPAASLMQAGQGLGSCGAHWRQNPSGKETGLAERRMFFLYFI